VSVERYLTALGLDAHSPKIGKIGQIAFASQHAMELYKGIALVVQTSASYSLPEPGYLQEYAEQMFSAYGYIWSSGNQRVAINGLNIDKAEDKIL
jgi:hypothetical protein